MHHVCSSNSISNEEKVYREEQPPAWMGTDTSPVTLFPEPAVAQPAHLHRTPWLQAAGPRRQVSMVSTSLSWLIASGDTLLTPQAMSSLCALCPQRAGALVALFLHG